ncbi:transposase [Streptomyces sp. CA-142005]|uniref:transposase n=1 Tax=Streptomyces sp. CA-142005 TaxID=3240052 RepID=UPI003D8C3F58
MIVVHGAGRSHGRTVGGAGAVVVQGSEGGTAAHLAPAAADRPHTVPGPTGVPWRDVPAEYGRPWGRVYDVFRRWQWDGTSHRIAIRQGLEHRPSCQSAAGAAYIPDVAPAPAWIGPTANSHAY